MLPSARHPLGYKRRSSLVVRPIPISPISLHHLLPLSGGIPLRLRFLRHSHPFLPQRHVLAQQPCVPSATCCLAPSMTTTVCQRRQRSPRYVRRSFLTGCRVPTLARVLTVPPDHGWCTPIATHTSGKGQCMHTSTDAVSACGRICRRTTTLRPRMTVLRTRM